MPHFHKSFRPYREARKFARSLKLENQAQWAAFVSGKMAGKGRRPPDVPSNPHQAYAGKGWAGYGDWLGTGNLSPRSRNFLPFADARAFARGLGLKNRAEWLAFAAGRLTGKGRIPSNVPSTPNEVYAGDGWAGFGDWIGTGNQCPRCFTFRPFAEARAFARSLGLKNSAEWRAFSAGKVHEKGRRPSDIPSNPNIIYAGKGWSGYGDWLGTGNALKNTAAFRPFAEAREFARTLKLKNTEWSAFCRGELPHQATLPPDIPKSPWSAYRNAGWISLSDWLRAPTYSARRDNLLPFSNAREFARNLKLKTGRQWHAYCRGDLPNLPPLPPRIPKNPDFAYRGKGWSGMSDWLDNAKPYCKRAGCRPFAEARAFVRSLKLRNWHQWHAYCRGEMPCLGIRPPDIPAAPQTAYKGHGWRGYGDWIGTGSVAPKNRVCRPFREARAFVRTLGLKNQAEWYACCVNKLPGKPPLPSGIPHNPHTYYAGKGWSGYADWLRPNRPRAGTLKRKRT